MLSLIISSENRASAELLTKNDPNVCEIFSHKGNNILQPYASLAIAAA